DRGARRVQRGDAVAAAVCAGPDRVRRPPPAVAVVVELERAAYFSRRHRDGGRGRPRGRAARDVIAGRLPADLAERARHGAVSGLDRPGVVAGADARRPARLVVRAIANPIEAALDGPAGA